MIRTGLFALAFASLVLVAPAASAQCPQALLVDGEEICYGSGGIDTPANVADGVYTLSAPLAAGATVCVHVDVEARIEAGGWDRVYLGWKDSTGKTATECLVGAELGDCTSTNAAVGCDVAPPVVWQIDDTLCWEPGAGATSVTVAVFVQPFDLSFQCTDGCLVSGPVELGVTVNELRVVGCAGGPVTGCGNGVVGAGEQCDDGNALAGDGCGQTCQREPGAICNDSGTACTAKNQCVAVSPADLNTSYCYANNDDKADSPLSWDWTLPGTGDEVLLQWDVQGGAEFHGTKTGEPKFDIVWLGWQDNLGGGQDFFLQDGGLNFSAFGEDFVDMWSLGSLAIKPTPGATTLTVTVYVSTDGATSCQQPKASLGPIPALFAESLTLTSCDVTATQYDTLAAFTESVGQCYVVHDFNAIADKTVGPFTGDGYVLTADTNKPGEQLTVSKSPYLTTQALGDGTPAIEAQSFGAYDYNSRLRLAFSPKPAVAVALNVIDAGDGNGVMAMEAYKDGELVFVDNDIDSSGEKNNFITWKGFVFSEPVDEVVFFMIEAGDFFNVDNLIVIPQQDGDQDGVPNLCDCAPTNAAVARTFPEVCDDGIDNDCDGLTDGVDTDCGGGGTAACADYADVKFTQVNAGWLVSGDQSWTWSAAAAAWRAVGANSIDSTLESGPIVVPAAACAEDVKVTVELGGSVQAPDSLVVSYSVDGGAFKDLETFTGALSPSTWSLPGVGPGNAVGFRFRYQTNATGLGADPTIARLRVFSDADLDKDGVCDACDCAPNTQGFGFDCDVDGDGYCAAAAGTLNSDPAVANCPNDDGGTGTDCNDAATTANPGKTTEAPLCSDTLDNDCDGKTDLADSDCAVATCTDKDGDGFGTGAGCLGTDCDDKFATCTTDCADADKDGIPDCADPCIDQDKDGYGKGPLCAGPDCNDLVATCIADCTTDLDGNGQADCAQPCVDKDGDGFGIGGNCLPDCDDTAATCTTNCADANNDGIPDCKAPGCVDPDGDGYGQGSECLGADCSEASAQCTSDCTDTDKDGLPNCLDDDDDDDDLLDTTETGTTKTDPLDPDTDDDGLDDGVEVNDTKTDPLDPDTDDDDLLDGTEVNTTKTDPLDPDTDDDDLTDGTEVNTTNTDPLDPDSDDDDLGDGTEVNTTTTNPNDPDSDDDDLSDGTEVNTTTTDPKDPDTDDDNLSDGTEVNDTKTDPLDPDTDDDGLKDGDEVLIHSTNPLDPDTDHGGVNDGIEVSLGQNPRNKPSDDFASGLIQGNGLSDCSAGGSRGLPWELLIALGILAFYRRRRWLHGLGLASLVAMSALALTTPKAHAADGFSIDLFQIQPGDDRVLSVKGSEVAPAWSPYGGFWVHYADDPLRLLFDINGVSGERRLVERRLTGQLGVGIGLFGFAEFQLGLPIVFKSKGDATRFPEIDKAAVGDLDLGLRFRLVERRGATKQGFGLALGLSAGVPTGSTDALAGENGATIRPRVDLSLGLGPVLLALNLGVAVRTGSKSFQNLALDHDLTWGFGARWRATEMFALAAEVFGRTRLTDPFAEDSESPIELVGGPQLRVARGLTIEAGAGTGLVPGYGAPDWRVYGGVQWAEPVAGVADTDGDGYPDPEDGCPLEPEDFDGFEDPDGCPDPDNDKDGILDVNDQCPMDPEDVDGFEDTDGCPDPDNDQDGILDVNDKCPMDPEDADGFEDQDGCPDPDNDQDGILDVDDKCPMEPETKNGFEDEDGCPDVVPLARMDKCTIVISDKIYFNTAKATIKPVSYPLLDAVAEIITQHGASFERVDIEGHTDNRGSKAYNLKLSDRRAASVRAYLIKKGIAPDKLRSQGFGFSRPVAPNDTEEGREVNRRVGFVAVGGSCGK